MLGTGILDCRVTSVRGVCAFRMCLRHIDTRSGRGYLEGVQAPAAARREGMSLLNPAVRAAG